MKTDDNGATKIDLLNLEQKMDKRFEKIDERFERIDGRFEEMDGKNRQYRDQILTALDKVAKKN